jgi:hypothetical protein
MSNYGDFAVMVFCAFATAFVIGLEWPRAPACAETLEDGRKLLSHTWNGKEARCKYAPPAAKYELSPEELRRMARAKERMARVQ